MDDNFYFLLILYVILFCFTFVFFFDAQTRFKEMNLKYDFTNIDLQLLKSKIDTMKHEQ